MVCNKCGAENNKLSKYCEYCGAPMKKEESKSIEERVPQTIEELKAFCAEKGLPLEQMRFFIGVDYKEPRAFGIYKDEATGEYVVYKNKDTGERSIRYQGTDEAYAVKELYLKMKEEVKVQREYKRGKAGKEMRSKQLKTQVFVGFTGFFFIAFFVMVVVITTVQHKADVKPPVPRTGYYDYADTVYYYSARTDDWYTWSTDLSRWSLTAVPQTDDLYADYNRYYVDEEEAEQNYEYDSIETYDLYETNERNYEERVKQNSNKKSSSSDDSYSDGDVWYYGGGNWDNGASNWGSDW